MLNEMVVVLFIISLLIFVVVDDFREVAQLMLQTHRFQGQAPRNGDEGGRVELLPIHWHATLYSGGTGIDR